MKNFYKLAFAIITIIFVTDCSNGEVSQINVYENSITINFPNGNSDSYITLNELDRQISYLKNKGDLVTKKFVFGIQGSFQNIDDFKILNEKSLAVKGILDKYNLVPLCCISQ